MIHVLVEAERNIKIAVEKKAKIKIKKSSHAGFFNYIINWPLYKKGKGDFMIIQFEEAKSKAAEIMKSLDEVRVSL